MSDKVFKVAGVSHLNGQCKVRFANDMTRVKTLAKTGHTAIDLIELPYAMTRGEIAVYLQEIDFDKGDIDRAQAIRHLFLKQHNKVRAAKPKTTTTAEMVDAAIL